jgi:hypothetical protein
LSGHACKKCWILRLKHFPEHRIWPRAKKMLAADFLTRPIHREHSGASDRLQTVARHQAAAS